MMGILKRDFGGREAVAVLVAAAASMLLVHLLASFLVYRTSVLPTVSENADRLKLYACEIQIALGLAYALLQFARRISTPSAAAKFGAAAEVCGIICGGFIVVFALALAYT